MLGTVAHAYNPSLGRQRVTNPWPTVELQADCRYFSKKKVNGKTIGRMTTYPALWLPHTHSCNCTIPSYAATHTYTNTHMCMC